MRTFYIFKINDVFKTLTLDKPYILYLAIDNIHSMDKKELPLAVKLYEEVCDKNDVRSLNLSIFNLLRDSDAYMKFNKIGRAHV